MLVTKNLTSHINNNRRPLIFLGSNSSMYKMSESAEDHGIVIAGIIDSDYYGNTEEICDLPVIDTELAFEDREKLQFYKDNYNFFCATNWTPEPDAVNVRNRAKRKKLLELIDYYQLPCISIVDRTARVSKHSSIGRGVFLDAHVLIEPKTTVGDFVHIYYNCSIGHHNIINRNCVLQRQCILMGNNVMEQDAYFGPAVKALKPGATFGKNSFVHEGIYIRRGTVDNEIVSMNSINQSRVVYQYVD